MAEQMERPPVKKRRHRFQKVEERVGNLQTELQLHAKTNALLDEASALTFKEELGLQAELTTLDSFQHLMRKLQPLVTTTPQLLHHLPKVVELLRLELQEAREGVISSDSDLVVQRQRLMPVLKLVTALARELRKEFYPHFASVLPFVVAVVDTKDPELSTQVFKTLTMLFNYLRVQLLADMDAVHQCYFPLLGHSRDFVRDFAAQTLAVLLRRLDSPKALRKYLRAYLRALTRGSGKDDAVLRDGSARLFLALVRNVNRGFHSRMRDVLLFLLAAFRPKSDQNAQTGSDDGEEQRLREEAVFEIVRQTCELMTKHTDPEHAGEMLDCLRLAVTKVAMQRSGSEAEDLYLSRLLRIVQYFLLSRIGKLVTDVEAETRLAAVHQICSTLLDANALTSNCVELRDALVQVFETVWRLFPAQDAVVATQTKSFFQAATDKAASEDVRTYWRLKMLTFVDQVLHNAYVEVRFVTTFVVPNALAFALQTLVKTDVGAFSSLICQLGSYVATHEGEIDADDSQFLVLASDSRRVLLSFEAVDAQADAVLVNAGGQVLKQCQLTGAGTTDEEDTYAETLALGWKFCKALALIHIDSDKLNELVKPMIAQCDRQLAHQSTDGSSIPLGALRAELWRLQQIAEHQQPESTTAHDANFVEQVLRGKESSFATLSALLEFIDMKTQVDQRALLTTDALVTVAPSLFATLRSPAHELRLVAMELLARFERLSFQDDGNNAVLSGPCDLLDVGVDLERTCGNLTVQNEREVVRLLTRVKVLCRSPQTPTLYKQAAVNHLLGLYHVKFATIWPHVADAVEAAARLHFSDLWPSISAELLAASIRPDENTGKTFKSKARRSTKTTVETEDKSAIADEFERVCALERGEVAASSCTDAATHHSLLWKGLVKFSDLVESKTRFMVPLFLAFLRDQYSRIYLDELDDRRLQEIDQALKKLEESDEKDASQWRQPREFSGLTTKGVRGKFVDQLKLFSTFRNMKGAYGQDLLHALFFELLMKSDEIVSKLALQCLFCFNSKALTAYKTQLNRLADSNSFREELTSFKVDTDSGVVLREHRAELLPVLLRLLYSKCVSKKGRNSGDTVAARRAAILAYLAALETQELAIFVELVMRAFEIPVVMPEDDTVVSTEVKPVESAARVQPSRILGFLNLLEDLIGQLGVKLAAFVPPVADVLLSILQISTTSGEEDAGADAVEVVDEKDEEEESETVAVGSKRKAGDATSSTEPSSTSMTFTSTSMKKQIRMLTYRRLAELIDMFDTLVSLKPWVVALLETSREAIEHLPGAVVGADKASALLDLLVAVGRADHASQWLPEPFVLSVVSCLSAGLTTSPADTTSSSSRGITPEILDAVLQFMGSLLDGDDYLLAQKDENEAMSDTVAKKRKENRTLMLVPHIPFVLSQFVLRFQAKAARYATDRYAGSSRKELGFLCRLSQHLDANTGDVASAAHDLFQLLLPFLLRSHHTSPGDKENLLQVLAHLVPKLSEPKKHVLALARLLAPGPNCITDRDPREKLVLVFTALGMHSTLRDLAPVAELLVSLNAYDARAIEETDVERRMVALNSLTNTRFSDFTSEAYLLAPLVAQTLQCMHDREFSVRSAALAALTGFLALAAEVAVQQKDEEISKSPVLNALESLVMPCIRSSVRSSSEDARRGFVTLLGALADHHEAFARFPFIPADLILARNHEDPEADFFYNITHIQAHRKRRALQRLGALMDEMAVKSRQAEEAGEEVTGSPQWFSNSTVNSVLLPLVMHFIYEAQAKSQESLRSEAAACVGSAAGLLGWSHYLALLRRLLKSIDGHAEMEAAIILAICAVVDHFHFEAPGAATHWKASTSTLRGKKHKEVEIQDPEEPEEGEENPPSKVQESMETQVLPMLHRYLFKGVGPKSSGSLAKTQDKDDEELSSSLASEAVAVRVPLALAVVKVLRRLRAATFHRELPKLLLRFATLLKSKDETVRTSARATLVKIAVELGARFLLPIVQELRHTLRDGYMVHVLSFTVHSLLEKLPAMLAADEAGPPRRPKSLLSTEGEAEHEEAFTSPLDACVPSLMDILASELFQGMMSADEAAEAAAGGVERNKARKSKMKEARASGGRGLDSLELLVRALPFLPNPSIHEVVGALVRRFRDTDAGAQASAALQEALKRVALGLTKNAAVEPSYVLLYAYNVLDACLESLRPATEREKARYADAGTNTQLVTSWLVSEKSAAATKLLAKRMDAREAARVTMHQQATGFDKLRQQEVGRKSRGASVDTAKENTVHLEELLNFAVFVVFSFLKTGVKEADKKASALTSPSAPAQLVDPLVPLLMRCAGEVKHDRVVMNSLKCLGALLPRYQELPALRVARMPLVERLFKILQKAGAATRNEMVQTCYRTLTALLKQQQGLELAQQDGERPATGKKDALRLTEPQLRVLLSFLSADLDEQDHANATYALLKAIVGARLVVSEVYDVMLRVGELLVQSDAPGARANCASIYLTFLLEYPLGPKRLARHLKFLVDNLNYGHATGRGAVLEALRALLSRLPQALVNARAQFFLLPLVLRVANDEAPECRELARVALVTLVRRLGNKELNESVQLLASWWSQTATTAEASSDAAKLLATAAQVSALVLETRPEFLERNATQVLRSARTALERSLAGLETATDSEDVRWQTPYHVCVALTAFSEHLTGPFEAWLEGADQDNKKSGKKTNKETTTAFLDAVALPLLEYPHAWVRLAATKLLGSYLRRRRASTLTFAGSVKRLPNDVLTRSHNGARYLQQPGRLFAWASALCKLLEAPAFDAELANEVLSALPFLCEALEAFPDIPQDVGAAADAAEPTVDENTEEAEVDVESIEEDAGEESKDDEEGTAREEDDADVEAEAETQRRSEQKVARTPVGWLLTRLSYVARGASRREAVQTAVFKLFAALLHSRDSTFAQTYVVQFMNPLYRASSTLQALQAQQEAQQLQKQQHGRRKGPAPEPVAPPESALLAQEVLELLERKLGPTAFLESYSFVQRKLALARATRKRQRQAEAVADPQRAAQRRMHKNQQKRHTKQMRKRKYTVLKGTASAATRPSKVQRPGAE